MRKVDITEKLSFAQPPVLIVKGRELTIRNDAATVLKVMEVMSGNGGFSGVAQCFRLFFDDTAMEALDELKLGIPDLQTLVTEAMLLATGAQEDDTPGEPQTRTMT